MWEGEVGIEKSPNSQRDVSGSLAVRMLHAKMKLSSADSGRLILDYGMFRRIILECP